MSRESDLRNLQSQASDAYEKGWSIFVARLKIGVWSMTPTGMVPVWGESIHTVESAGWVLDKWAVTTDSGGASSAFPVVRRNDTWTPQDRPTP